MRGVSTVETVGGHTLVFFYFLYDLTESSLEGSRHKRGRWF
jgi:hypothetical protein